MRTSLRALVVLVALAGLLAACEGAGTPGPNTPAATGLPMPPAGAATPPGAAGATPGPGDGKVNLGALYHMSRDPLYRSPPGPVPAGSAVTLRLKTARGDLTAASMRVWDSVANAEQVLTMTLERRSTDADYWSLQLPTPAKPDVLWYRFQVRDGASSGAYQDDKARD